MARKKKEEAPKQEEVAEKSNEPLTLNEARKDTSKEDKPVQLTVEETDELEASGEKRHGFAPTTGNIQADETVEKEKTEPKETTVTLNEDENDKEHTEDEKKGLEEDLSKDNIVARVVTWTGNYLKVKFLRDGKPFFTYKGKTGDAKSAKSALQDALKKEDEAKS